VTALYQAETSARDAARNVERARNLL